MSTSKDIATIRELKARIEELEEELAQTEEAREAIDNSLRKVGKERDELRAQIKELKEVGWCVLGSIQDKDDKAYLKAALQENEL